MLPANAGMIPAQQVGERVRARLRDRRLTQTDLAGVLDLTQSVISDRVRGVVAFDVDELATTAEFLGCPVSDLLPEEPQTEATA